ncbi:MULTISPECIES: substrate-binding domain-containing protein [Fibrobacter]|uniref:Phosphate transport system substrate-binding protein n=1 Tax=Fibrobacter intestinalis TaxID=28122 RepID=A0A1M6PWD5_9BACT|nr:MULTISPECIES: substrate-binding domain-containing protein [Fibrobacter]MDD7298500.1 extracellular solute-binding protein [Fibrobacter intestinalis]PBC68915.1 phosphate transport system substrate-binding protein [Fibrobacter sp. UWS1]SHK12230.1 phosphate transport system substrate-binding protein [Fibrobacter intestinalis]
MNKLTFVSAIAGIVVLAIIAACRDDSNSKKLSFDTNREITVITREAGSGTRDAFTELVGILVKQNGKKKDNTTVEALTIDGTQGVISTVAGNEYAIGYISLGSMNNSVKALKIDGVSPDKLNVKRGTYPIARPFNVATKSQISEIAQDFLDFIMSADGQSIVDANGYVSVVEGKVYESKNLKGKIVIAGSSSVSPVMEKLKEGYLQKNPGVEIEIQTNDSSSGMLAAKEGTCDIGMASRDLKSSEKDVLNSLTIARDGIAVIVNSKNPQDNLNKETLRQIYTGLIRNWNVK